MENLFQDAGCETMITEKLADFFSDVSESYRHDTDCLKNPELLFGPKLRQYLFGSRKSSSGSSQISNSQRPKLTQTFPARPNLQVNYSDTDPRRNPSMDISDVSTVYVNGRKVL